MPPKKIPSPMFSPTGRYIIDVSTKKDNPIFHDTYGDLTYCEIEKITSGSMSRFDSKIWAQARGFSACTKCKEI